MVRSLYHIILQRYEWLAGRGARLGLFQLLYLRWWIGVFVDLLSRLGCLTRLQWDLFDVDAARGECWLKLFRVGTPYCDFSLVNFDVIAWEAAWLGGQEAYKRAIFHALCRSFSHLLRHRVGNGHCSIDARPQLLHHRAFYGAREAFQLNYWLFLVLNLYHGHFCQFEWVLYLMFLI